MPGIDTQRNYAEKSGSPAAGIDWVVVATITFATAGLLFVKFAFLPQDIEDIYSSLFSTVMSWKLLLNGDDIFWLEHLGFGVAFPFRFSLFQHPLSISTALINPAFALRILEVFHVVVGFYFMHKICYSFARERRLSLIGATSFILGSSIIQPFAIDDWSSALINNASLPVVVYGAVRAVAEDELRKRWLLTIGTGTFAGVLVATVFPLLLAVNAGIIASVTLLQLPREKRTQAVVALLWIAAIAAAIGAAQLLSIFQQVAASGSVARYDHAEPPTWLHFWSMFARPFGPLAWSEYWRTIYFGSPFAWIAIIGLLFARGRDLLPYRLLLIFGFAVCVAPIPVPFGLITDNWIFRNSVNFAGIVLAVSALGKMRTAWPIAATLLTFAQALVIAASTALLIYKLALPFDARQERPRQFDRAFSGLAGDIPPMARRARLALDGTLGRDYQASKFADIGLLPNLASLRGDLTIVDARLRGIGMDAFVPDTALLEGNIWLSDPAVNSGEWLDVLGIEYLLSAKKRPHLQLVEAFDAKPGPLRYLYRNDNAWSLATFVIEPIETSALPFLEGCDHDRALCRDWGEISALRDRETVTIVDYGSRIELEFSASDKSRYLFLPVNHDPYWRTISEGVAFVAETKPFIGLRVNPGATSAIVERRNPSLALLTWMSIAIEIGAMGAFAVLVVAVCRQTGQRQNSRASRTGPSYSKDR